MSASRKPRVRPRISQREARKLRLSLAAAATEISRLARENDRLDRENKDLLARSAPKAPETKKLFDLTCGPIGRLHIEAPQGDDPQLLPFGIFVSLNYHGMMTAAARLGWALRIKAEPRPAAFTGLLNNKTTEYDFIVEAVKP